MSNFYNSNVKNMKFFQMIEVPKIVTGERLKSRLGPDKFQIEHLQKCYFLRSSFFNISNFFFFITAAVKISECDLKSVKISVML